MFSLADSKLFWEDLSLSEMKNIEKVVTEDCYKITKPNDEIVIVPIMLLKPDSIRMFDAFVEQYMNRIAGYHTDLDKARADKILELEIDCYNSIHGGFASSAYNGIEKTYSYYGDDSSRMQGILLLSTVNPYLPIYWKAANELIAYEWTKEQFAQLCVDAYVAELVKVRFYHELRYMVSQLQTVEEVQAVEW
jgi:hypothetical protein